MFLAHECTTNPYNAINHLNKYKIRSLRKSCPKDMSMFICRSFLKVSGWALIWRCFYWKIKNCSQLAHSLIFQIVLKTTSTFEQDIFYARINDHPVFFFFFYTVITSSIGWPFELTLYSLLALKIYSIFSALTRCQNSHHAAIIPVGIS